VKNEAEVDSMIAAWTKQRTKYEAMTQVGGAGIPAGAVLDTMELLNEPTSEARGIMQVMPHKTHPVKMPSWPVRINGKPPTVKSSPGLGEHTSEVLKSWLGLDSDEIGKLKTNKIV
jgi:formyl-CoA transferase